MTTSWRGQMDVHRSADAVHRRVDRSIPVQGAQLDATGLVLSLPRETELEAGEEEPALVAQHPLLRGPGSGLVLADPLAAGDEALDHRRDRGAVGVGVEIGGREAVALHLDVLKFHGPQAGRERAG